MLEKDREFTAHGYMRYWCHICGKPTDYRDGAFVPAFCPRCGAEATPPDSREKVIRDMKDGKFVPRWHPEGGVFHTMPNLNDFIARIDALVEQGRWSE